jgi:hypothetical protein
MNELNAVAGSDNVFRDLGFPEAEAQNLLTRSDRTYHVSDERLRAFAQLSYAQRLQWVEQCSQFVRLAQRAKAELVAATPNKIA